ncbi:Helix-turn-helix domain-containing protein [Quadrisphaera granulorum]|uniref:Helix-turn-helix protein n=1 Tax=Quadrisphaera granulorum TaxID=317664 RepID=A0A316AE28_9ACTN|nr:helix-turn-helix domain-containing protein [Quadrisphaera granulorum]PWJ55134.1 helix-turn-helix protein [Quadrisphaera granulorum]SZE95643.1 Helix-turn-helix domain-containing protein [Quadrisphaera granulorum]
MVGRPERELLDDGSALVALALALRELRRTAGSPSYREMGQRVHRSPTTLSEAAGGERQPTWDTVHAYVTACGGSPDDWRERWEAAARRAAPAPAATVSPPAPAPEPASAPVDDRGAAIAERRPRAPRWWWVLVVVAAAFLGLGLGVGLALGGALARSGRAR